MSKQKPAVSESPLKQNRIVPLDKLVEHPRNVSNLALRADLCYNEDLKYCGSEGAANTFRLVTHLLRRQVTMDTLSSHISEGKTFIYGLIDPDTKLIRYIGKSNNPQIRLYRHLREKGSSYKNRWLQSLKVRGLVPEIVIIEEVLIEQWQERERYWIAFYHALGYDLANGTDGGDGVHGRKRTQEERERISASLMGNQYSKGHTFSPERKSRHSEALKGHNVKPGTRAKISASKIGKSPSAATRAKISATLSGSKVSEQSLSKRRGRQHSETHKANISVALTGRTFSETHKANLRLAVQRRKAGEQ